MCHNNGIVAKRSPVTEDIFDRFTKKQKRGSNLYGQVYMVKYDYHVEVYSFIKTSRNTRLRQPFSLTISRFAVVYSRQQKCSTIITLLLIIIPGLEGMVCSTNDS